MHEFKHGELHSGRSDGKKGPLVHDRRQALAIALSRSRTHGSKREYCPHCARRVEVKAEGGDFICIPCGKSIGAVTPDQGEMYDSQWDYPAAKHALFGKAEPPEAKLRQSATGTKQPSLAPPKALFREGSPIEEASEGPGYEEAEQAAGREGNEESSVS